MTGTSICFTGHNKIFRENDWMEKNFLSCGIDKLMDQNEVAWTLGVSVKTLESWRWKKVGPKYIKVGRLARYRMSDIVAYVQSLIEEEVEEKSCKGNCSCK